MKLHKIKAVRVLPAAQAVVIEWDNGSQSVKDMSRLIATRKVFAPLKRRKLFERVEVADGGRAIRWSDEIDFCADALWLEAQEARGKVKAAAE
jgi:hypothetical protein